MKKKYIATALVLTVVAGYIMQPISAAAAVYESDEEALAPLEELTAGGFYVEENSYVDADSNAFFVADTMQDAAQIIDNYKLDADACVISDEISDCVIVQTDLTNSEANRLEMDERVSNVEGNYLVYGCTDGTEVADSGDLTQWYLNALNVDQDAQTAAGTGVKVELLDSGVSYVSALENVQHVDLTFSDEETGFTDVLFDDNSGHGTAMAGLIAANSPDGSLTGINPNAELYSVKILDDKLQAPVSKVIEGIYWGIEHQVDIINMSFGTEVNSEALHSAVKAASDAGILLIAAAGNNESKGILYPAAYPEVVAVGATTSEGTVLSGTASGTELELLAPGNQIISTGMVDGYSSGSGTSLATAEVTGVASLLLGQPGATADVVRGLLSATAKDIEGSDAGLVDYGYAAEHFAEYLAAFQNNEVDEAVFDNPTVAGTYDTEGIVNGLWSENAHEWLVNKADETVELNSTYVTLLCYAARQADNKDTYHDMSSHPEYKPLHGFGVYTANIYAIWKFANYTKQGKDANTAKNFALADLKAATNYKNITTDDPTEGLLDACERLITGDADVANKKYNSTDAKKKYLVAGFACHMIGDVYAHRTLVPVYAIQGAGSSAYASNNSSDFASRLGISDFKNWSQLSADITNKNVTFTDLKKYKKDGINKFNEIYEDNTEFCRERLNAALNCTRDFLGQISSANNTAKSDIIKQQTNVELIKYSTYMGYFN